MKHEKPIDKICIESEILEQHLLLDGKEILELGCGSAAMTRLIATNGKNRNIIATEVDEIQHNKNRLINDLNNVKFIKAGAEKIPLEDQSIDVVFMFKSFHHIPIDLMQVALQEIKRILKADGMVYISEPIFDGEFNQILRLFHDEEKVRDRAYKEIHKSIKNKDFTSIDEIFFNTQRCFKNFEEFEVRTINVTHSQHQLSATLQQQVKAQFALHMQEDGAKFLLPIRVNLLQKIN